MNAQVIKSTGSWYEARLDSGETVSCRIKGKFRLRGMKTTNPIAVGDRVEVEMEENQDTGVIVELRERENYIIRKSVNLSKQAHIIAANIDQSVLIVSLVKPETSRGFMDRFLVSSEAYGVKSILVFNKMDLIGEKEEEELVERLLIYKEAGYEIVLVSAKTNDGLEDLRHKIQGKTTLFSGHSGVGKSTLINAIQPGLGLKTGEVSGAHKKGQHTTTFAEMFELEGGGKVIDTPGIKGFGMVDMEAAEVPDYFPEFFETLPDCKFHNCKHLNEPGCAVLEKIEKGELPFSRYNSYLSILEELEEVGPYRKPQ